MVSHRSSPLVETVTGLPPGSRTTSEQVASNPRPATSSGAAPAMAMASRIAGHTDCQIYSLSSSASFASVRFIAIGCSDRPSRAPCAVSTPARALPVPTSTATRRLCVKARAPSSRFGRDVSRSRAGLDRWLELVGQIPFQGCLRPDGPEGIQRVAEGGDEDGVAGEIAVNVGHCEPGFGIVLG